MRLDSTNMLHPTPLPLRLPDAEAYSPVGDWSALAAELASAAPGLFRRRRLLLAALPYRAEDGLRVCFVVQGQGCPLDEEPLPTEWCGRPTTVALGLPRQACDLQAASASSPHMAGFPLHAPAELSAPLDEDGNGPCGTLGAHAKRGEECVLVTAGHILMTVDEWRDFEERNDVLRDEYPPGNISHQRAFGSPLLVGERCLLPDKLHPKGITDAGLGREPQGWRGAQERPRHSRHGV